MENPADQRLSAVVIQLRAERDGRIRGGTGRGTHALWLDPWKIINPEIGERLHQRNRVVPFTISPLMGLPNPERGVLNIHRGDQPWLRITTLTTAETEALYTWLPHLSQKIIIADVPFLVQRVILPPAKHPWVAETTYKDLAASVLFNPHPPDKWLVQFVTPTTFHGVSGHFPFPLPDSLVKSWLLRWNEFSPLELPGDFDLRIREAMLISAYELKTVPVRHGKRLIVGCVGELFLRAGKLHPAERAIFDTLCSYAFYAGTGQKTPQGMGMTRVAWG